MPPVAETTSVLPESRHLTVKAYFVTSAAWMVIATLYGLMGAIELVAPDLLGNIAWLVFGRIRQVHTSLVIFGFVGAGLLGAAHYLVPALTRAPLASERLGLASVALYNLALLSGTVTLSLGYTQNREYAEWIWPVDVVVMLAFAAIFTNVMMTIARRRERLLYVSVWYVVGGLVFSAFNYFFGNAMWNPQTGAVFGMPDAILAWFYGHNVVGLFLTPLAVAIAYYVIPVVCRAPLYSHTLSLVGFWSILMLYTHIGTHHLLQAPAPTWLKVVAVVGSIGMIVPVATVLVNLWLTMRGKIAALHGDIGGKFVFAGTVWYVLTCIQGPLQSLPHVQKLTHFNNWVVAHAHMGVLGFSGTMALGAIWFFLPRVTGRPLWSTRLADIQYWMVLLGMAGFFAVLTAAGLVQGNGWLNGETVYRVLPQIHIYMIMRLGIGLMLVFAAFLGLANVLMSLRAPRAPGERP